MPTRLTCARGHQWDAPDTEPSSSLPSALCPVCATAASSASGPVSHAGSSTANGAKDPYETKPPLLAQPPAGLPSAPAPVAAPGEAWAIRLTPAPPLFDSWATRAPGAAGVGPGTLPIIPGYELLGELGRGGMGVVYKARQLGFDRIVALKMIVSGGHVGADEHDRFRTEAEAVARLQHPHIVQVYQIGDHEGRPFFSLEYCGGGSLDKKLRATPWPPPKAAGLVETLARAVHVAHRQRVIHRDLKPGNILLTDEGVPKITDFGLAKKLDDSDRTWFGTVMGTPSYMAPEQALGKTDEIGPLADVYALGAILYEALTGRPPFKGPTERETIEQVIADEPVAPRKLQPKTPRDLETICLKCLQKVPEKRYKSAEALAEDLRRFLAGEPIEARRASWLERRWRSVKRRPLETALGAALILGACILGAYVVTAVADSRIIAEEKRHQGELEDMTDHAVEALSTCADILSNDEELRKRHDLEPLHKGLKFVYEGRYKNADNAQPQLADAKARDKAARICYAAGLFEKNLGSKRDAVDPFDRAETMYLELLAGAGAEDRDDLRRRLALVYMNRGEALASLADRAPRERAPRDFDGALKHLGNMTPQAGTTAVFDRDLIEAEVYHLRGNFHLAAQAYDAAEDEYNKALNIRERLKLEHPQDPRVTRELSRSHGYLGDVYLLRGKWGDAKTQYVESEEFRRELYQRNPNDPDRKFQLARGLSNFGDLYRDQWEKEFIPEGIAKYKEALKYREELMHDYPAVTEYATDLGRNYLRLAAFSIRRDDKAKAEDYVKKAQSIYEGQLSLNPKDKDVLIGVGEVNLFLGFLRTDGDNSNAAREYLEKGKEYYDQVAEKELFDRNDWFRLAACYSLLSECDREKRAKHLGSAKVCLRKAVEAGYINLARLDSRGLRAVHEAPGFKELREALEAKVLKY